ncbi:MAG TPA: response regulator [Terriglobales bacterium]|nr:response regulator [Terriglobales bacterium]
MIRVLIVDDEPLARERLRTLLAAAPDCELAGEASDGAQAVAAIQQTRPDLVFLDVQMPEVDGFDVLAALDHENMPEVVFVTAYDKYALHAFERQAIDYLLKPFDNQRFYRALERARTVLEARRQRQLNPALLRLIEQVSGNGRKPGRLVFKSSGRVVFLPTETIDYVQATGNYVTVHAGAESHLLRDTMTNLEQKLDTAKFARIHRSSIVNVDRIKTLEPVASGDYVVLLRNGARLQLSRTYRERLASRIGMQL